MCSVSLSVFGTVLLLVNPIRISKYRYSGNALARTGTWDLVHTWAAPLLWLDDQSDCTLRGTDGIPASSSKADSLLLRAVSTAPRFNQIPAQPQICSRWGGQYLLCESPPFLSNCGCVNVSLAFLPLVKGAAQKMQGVDKEENFTKAGWVGCVIENMEQSVQVHDLSN